VNHWLAAFLSFFAVHLKIGFFDVLGNKVRNTLCGNFQFHTHIMLNGYGKNIEHPKTFLSWKQNSQDAGYSVQFAGKTKAWCGSEWTGRRWGDNRAGGKGVQRRCRQED
jgi:hypothetical protein